MGMEVDSNGKGVDVIRAFGLFSLSSIRYNP